jgi:hypothetical protein
VTIKPRLLLLALLVAALILPTRISAQDEPPSAARSVGVTAAEFGAALAISCAGTVGTALALSVSHPLFVSGLALTPVLSAAGTYGIGEWFDPGGQLGATALGGYAGAIVVGVASGGIWHLASSGSEFDFITPIVALVGYVAGTSVGSVVGYKLSRRPLFVAEPRCQLIPPSMGLTLKRPAAGRPMEIAGVRVNLLGARF